MFYAILSILLLGLTIAIYWQLWYKAGYSGWWSLLVLIPVVGFLSIGILAFSRWPVHDALTTARRRRDLDLFD